MKFETSFEIKAFQFPLAFSDRGGAGLSRAREKVLIEKRLTSVRAKEIYEGGASRKKWNISDNVQYFYPTHLFLANISACKGDILKEVPPREEMELF